MATFEAGPVPREALEYFRDKDVRTGFDYQDVWAQEHAHAFTVAKAMKLDILDDLRAGLDDALAEGKPFREFARDLKPQLEKKGWWGVKDEIDPNTGERRTVQLGSPRRLKTIYQSNLRSARAAGQWERAQRTKESLPYLLYELGPSKNHRDKHVSWAGTLLPVDDPWWRDHMPPNGYGCKCRVRQVSEVEAQRMGREGVQNPRAELDVDPGTGLPTGRRQRRTMPVRREAPPTRATRYTNQRTGETTQVDQGLHPAWASNPGQDRVRVLRDRMTGKLDTLDQRLAEAAARDVMASPILDQWVDRADGELPAGLVDRQVQAALGATTQVVRLSPGTFNQQLRSHADLTTADYRQLPQRLARGITIESDRPGHAVVFSPRTSPSNSPNRWWKAVLKRTGDQGRLYLVSYQKADDADLRRTRSRGRVIRAASK
jgi:hypothetical protein